MKNKVNRALRAKKRFVIYLTIFGALCAGCALSSCNVTRRMTTESSYIQRGDTNVVIITKTIESYDARKNVP